MWSWFSLSSHSFLLSFSILVSLAIIILFHICLSIILLLLFLCLYFLLSFIRWKFSGLSSLLWSYVHFSSDFLRWHLQLCFEVVLCAFNKSVFVCYLYFYIYFRKIFIYHIWNVFYNTSTLRMKLYPCVIEYISNGTMIFLNPFIYFL